MAIEYRKYLVTHSVNFGDIDGTCWFTNGFIIPNHYNHSITSFEEMVAEALKSFPKIPRSEFECLTVRESSWCKSCPIIRFLIGDGKGATSNIDCPDDWTVCKDRLPDISW